MEEKLGSYLVKNDILTEDQLREAIEECRKTGQRLITVLNDLKLVAESKLLAQLSNLYRMEVVDLEYIIPSDEILALIPTTKAYHYEVLPIQRRGRYLTVAMVDPTDINAMGTLKNLVILKYHRNHPPKNTPRMMKNMPGTPKKNNGLSSTISLKMVLINSPP